jgi:hypothetical protein
MRFLHALIAINIAIQKVSVKRNVSSAQKTIQLQEEIRGRQMLCEGNYPDNYKNCIVYKDLQKKFFPTLRRKVIVPESQP